MSRPTTEFTAFPPILWSRTWSWQPSEEGAFNAATEFGVYAKYRTYSGSVTPGYRSLSRRHKLKLQPLDYNMTLKRVYGDQYNERITYVYYTPYVHTQSTTYTIGNSAILLSTPGSVSHLSEAGIKARSRLAAQVNGMSMNVGQAFAERGQTASLIGSTISRVTNAALALRRGRLGDFVTSLGLESGKVSAKSWSRVLKTPPSKRIANHWVEYQYGWKPLLQDLYGASELLSDRIRNDPWQHSLKSSGKAEEKSYNTVNDGGIKTQYFSQHSTKARFAAHFKMDSYAQAALSATGLSNPALLAWELLPYSFVVDWFLPVGNYLESLTAFNGFTFVVGSESYLSRLQWQQSTSGEQVDNLSPYQRHTNVSWSGGYDLTTYTRTTTYSWPAPSFPSFKNPIGGEPVQRFATALALLTQVFKH